MFLGKKQLISYALLAFCLAFIGLPIYIFLPNYYADNFNLDLKTIAVILLVTRLVDTVQDPIFGIISDKFSSLKKKFICYFCPLLGISFLLLFNPLSTAYLEIWLAVFLITTYSLYSIIYLNYQAYAVGFSKDYHFKTKIISYREVCFIAGIIFASASPAILYRYFSETNSFLFIAITFTVLITAFALLFNYYVPNNTYTTQAVKGKLKDLLKKSILRKYFLFFFINAISSSIPAVLILFFVDEILNAKNLVGLFLILYFSGLLAGVLLWTRISKVLNDKVKTFLISITFTVCVFLWCFFLSEGDILLYALICVFSGLGFGGDFALSYSILTDIIHKHNLQESESTLFGISNFLIKFALTIASASMIYLIGTFENDVASKKQFISVSYALLPILFRCCGAFILYKNFKIHDYKKFI